MVNPTNTIVSVVELWFEISKTGSSSIPLTIVFEMCDTKPSSMYSEAIVTYGKYVLVNSTFSKYSPSNNTMVSPSQALFSASCMVANGSA